MRFMIWIRCVVSVNPSPRPDVGDSDRMAVSHGYAEQHASRFGVDGDLRGGYAYRQGVIAGRQGADGLDVELHVESELRHIRRAGNRRTGDAVAGCGQQLHGAACFQVVVDQRGGLDDEGYGERGRGVAAAACANGEFGRLLVGVGQVIELFAEDVYGRSDRFVDQVVVGAGRKKCRGQQYP